MPTFLKYKYILFLISNYCLIRIFFQLSRIRIQGKKCWILIPGMTIIIRDFHNPPLPEFFRFELKDYMFSPLHTKGLDPPYITGT